jgi:hypothetical protein
MRILEGMEEVSTSEKMNTAEEISTVLVTEGKSEENLSLKQRMRKWMRFRKRGIDSQEKLKKSKKGVS